MDTLKQGTVIRRKEDGVLFAVVASGETVEALMKDDPNDKGAQYLCVSERNELVNVGPVEMDLDFEIIGESDGPLNFDPHL